MIGRLRGNGSEQSATGHDVFDGLLGAGVVEATFKFQPIHGGGHALRPIALRVLRRNAWNKRANFLAQLGDMGGEFVCSRWSFAAPERNVGCRALRVFHQDAACLHAANAPGRISQQHDVSRETFDGEVFVNSPNNGGFGLCDDACRANFLEWRRRW